MIRVGFALACVACVACGRVSFDERSETCTSIPGELVHFAMNAGDVAGGGVHDLAGNDHHGAIIGAPGPVIAQGRFDQALDFSATTGAYVEVDGLPLPTNPGEAVTISLWFFRAPNPLIDDVIIDIPPPAPPDIRYDLWLTTGSHLCFNTATSDCWGVIDPFLPDRWVHTAVVFRNGPTIDSELYIDGVKQASFCATGASFNSCAFTRTVMNPLHLGSSDYPLRALLDEVRLYDHALTVTEIAALYQNDVCAP